MTIGKESLAALKVPPLLLYMMLAPLIRNVFRTVQSVFSNLILLHHFVSASAVEFVPIAAP